MSDHYLVYTNVCMEAKTTDDSHNQVTFRDYKHFDELRFIESVRQDDVLTCSDFNSISWETWHRRFLKISEQFAPLKTMRLKERANPWITRDIIKAMQERDRLHREAIGTRSDSLMAQYRRLRN